ncbi:MAG: hypothetical protein WD356_04465 [Pseudomonadales bacterium]
MERVKETLRKLFAGRPVWINALMVFCLYMTFIYLPFDLFVKPVAQDQEVWFGIVLTGWAAKATAPLHWAIYGAGAWGFYRMRPWMWPWASLYVVQVAIGMFVWTATSAQSGGLLAGAIVSIPFIALAVALWLAKPKFQGQAVVGTNGAEGDTLAPTGGNNEDQTG